MTRVLSWFRLVALLAALWSLAGLIFVFLVPFYEDDLVELIDQETGLSLNCDDFGGYFYFTRVGIRLSQPQLGDELGPIVEARLIEIEFNPISQWLSGFFVPILVKAEGIDLVAQLREDNSWTFQKRYELLPETATVTEPTAQSDQTSDETADAIAASATGNDEQWQDQMNLSQLDLGSELDKLLGLFEIFGGRVSINNASLTLFLQKQGIERTLSGINVSVQGGDEPEMFIEVVTPGSYSKNLYAEVKVDRSSQRYLHLHYDVSLNRFSRVFFDDFFPGALAFGDIDASIRLRGSINPLRQSHQFDFSISESKLSSRGLRLPLLHFEGGGYARISENSMEFSIPKLLFQKGSPGIGQHLLIESLNYSDVREKGHPVEVEIEMVRLQIKKQASLALIELKNRLVPSLLPELDAIIADMDLRKLHLAANLYHKTILDAGGQARINHLQVEEGTHFSNLSFYISAFEEKLILNLRAVATDLAIEGIIEPVNIHAVSDMVVTVSKLADDWFIEAQSSAINLTADQNLAMEMSVEFKEGYSPWIYLHIKGEQMDVDILQNYIPRQLLEPELDRWLWQSVSGGVVAGSVEYGGNVILDEPEIRPEVFTLDGKMNGVTVLYQDGWPSLTLFNGQIGIANSMFHFNAETEYSETVVSLAGNIVDFDKPVISIRARSQGYFSDARDFIQKTPFREKFSDFFDAISGDGWIGTRVNLDVDLDDFTVQYRGQIEIADLNLELVEIQLALTRVYGLLHFDQNSLRSEYIRADFGGQELRAQINTVNEMGAERISVEVTTGENEAGSILGMPSLLKSAGIDGSSVWYIRYLSGAIKERPDGDIVANDIRSFLFFHSDFVGVEIADNTSINKEPKDVMPVSVVITDTEYGNRIVWLLLDDKIDSRIFLDVSSEAISVAAAYVHIYNPDDLSSGNAMPVDGRIDTATGDGAEDTTNVAGEPKPTPLDGLFDGPPSPTLSSIRDKGQLMWNRVIADEFYELLVDGEIYVEGRLKELKLKPWMDGFISVTDTPGESQKPISDADNSASGNEQALDVGLSYRMYMGIDSVNAFGFDFNSVDFSLDFNDNSVNLGIDSLESNFDLFYDLLNRQPMKIDILRLEYDFDDPESGTEEVADKQTAATDDDDAEGADAKSSDQVSRGKLDAGTEDDPASDADGGGDGGTNPGVAANLNSAGDASPGESETADVTAAGPTDADDAGTADVVAAPTGELNDTQKQSIASESIDIAGELATTDETTNEAAPQAANDTLLDAEAATKLFKVLHSFDKISLYCNLCRIDEINLRDIEGLVMAGTDQLDFRLRYSSDGIGDNISINLNWQQLNDQMKTDFVMKASSDEMRKTSGNHGASALMGGKGEAHILANWNSNPLDIDYASLNGRFNIDVREGVLYDLGSSSAQRLLSIVNLLEIPRRFSLDFSDLGQNLEFYRATLNANIHNGVVLIDETEPMHLRSSLGFMDAFGTIDLANQRYDIGAHVIPNVVTYTAPVVALLLAGPIAGVGVIALNWVLNIFGVDTNTIAEQYNLVDSSFDAFELNPVSRTQFRRWAAAKKSQTQAAEPTPDSDGQNDTPPEAGEGLTKQPASDADSQAPSSASDADIPGEPPTDAMNNTADRRGAVDNGQSQ